MIPLTKPAIAFDEVAGELRGILESGILTGGSRLRHFEQAVARYVGVKEAVATSSGTTALHLILAAAGIGRGDDVLVSDFTFPASGNTIAQCGATPVPVDCQPGRFVLDLEHARAQIAPRTRALMVVDPFGEPADLERAAELAAVHDLLLIEDSACALGAELAGRRCGSWPGAGCFSFHPRKIITTGEGGMLTTGDEELAQRARQLRNHGGVPTTVGMRFERHGFNYRMSEIQAALGSAQLTRVDDLLAARRAAAGLYLDRLVELPEVQAPAAASAGSTYQSFVVLLEDSIDRDGVVSALRARGIEATLGTYAMHAHPAFAAYGLRPGDLPHAYRAQRQSLTLPLWPGIEEAVVEHVVRELQEAIGGGR